MRAEGLQDLFGAGRLFSGYNYVVGPAEFWVHTDGSERARPLLDGLGTPPSEPAADSSDDA